jgi:hypothetical protein
MDADLMPEPEPSGERRRGPWWFGYVIPLVVSIGSLGLSAILWVNASQNEQNIKLAVLESNQNHTQESLHKIESDIAAIRAAIEGKKP